MWDKRHLWDWTLEKSRVFFGGTTVDMWGVDLAIWSTLVPTISGYLG